ncbi:uL30 family ribosomal protein [Candidatus Woesearchaeota archaeon]|nr:uL30 family ribosomal protein [Candidatus Woesearchaeota archaeon]
MNENNIGLEKNRKSKKIAIIRVRGTTGVMKPVKDTLNMLRLYKKNCCVVLNDGPNIIGMIKKAKDYITWGEIDDETLKLLTKKRGEKTKDEEGKETIKPFFRLNPPRKGFGRKGIKLPFGVGGALGDRKDKINDLIKRMV